MTLAIRLALAATVAVALPSLALAQISGTRAWGALGLGAGFPATGGDGITNMAQLVVRRQPHHFALRALVMHDIESSTDPLGDEITEVGAVYGRTRSLFGRNVAIATGLSVVAFENCPRDAGSCATLGLPLVVEGAVTRGFAGIGAQLFAQLNPKASYVGLVLTLQLGRH